MALDAFTSSAGARNELPQLRFQPLGCRRRNKLLSRNLGAAMPLCLRTDILAVQSSPISGSPEPRTDTSGNSSQELSLTEMPSYFAERFQK